MTTILELFNALVPYLMTFSFQVLWQIPEKIRLGQASEALRIITIKIKDIGFAAITDRITTS